MNNEFQYRLQKAISEKGISASELSRISGVGKADISNYINGVYVAKQDKCYLLAKALGVDPGWLMTGDETTTRDRIASAFLELEKEEEKEVDELVDLYISFSRENRDAAHKYMLYLKSQEAVSK